MTLESVSTGKVASGAGPELRTGLMAVDPRNENSAANKVVLGSTIDIETEPKALLAILSYTNIVFKLLFEERTSQIDGP